MAQSYDSGKPSRYLPTWVTLASGETLPSRTFHAKLHGQSAVSTRRPIMLQHPLEKQVTSSCTYKDQIFFGSRVTHFSRDPSQSSTDSYISFFFKEATRESTTINELLYTHETLIVARGYDAPRDWLWDACHMAGVHWGSHCKGFHSKEGLHYCFIQSARNMIINQNNFQVQSDLLHDRILSGVKNYTFWH